MRVLVCGASGFVGQAVCTALRRAGHRVVRGVRRPAGPDDVAIDYSTDTTPTAWLPRLAGIEAVVNAVGIIAERPGATFEDLHVRAPQALFAACRQAGVQRVVQVSTLGADTGDTAYFRSKAATDRCLMTSTLRWQLLRPSLVHGDDGASASALRMLSTMPLIVLPSLPTAARFRPVHVDDLAAAVVKLLEPQAPTGQCIDCVGATSHTLRELLAGYRRDFRLGPPLWLPVPAPVMALAARLAGLVPGAALNPETWRMLQRGSSGEPAAFARLLGRAPRGFAEFIAIDDAERLCARALRAWQRPMLRLALATVWIFTAITSLFLFPRTESLALLARVGLAGPLATASLYLASTLDLLLGIAALAWPRRSTWIAQGALMAVYTAVIAVAMPDWLVHPFGPILKNLPMLAILVLLFTEETPWPTSS